MKGVTIQHQHICEPSTAIRVTDRERKRFPVQMVQRRGAGVKDRKRRRRKLRRERRTQLAT